MYEKTRILLIPVDYFIYPKIIYYKCLIRFNKFGYFRLKDRKRSKDRILTDNGKEYTAYWKNAKPLDIFKVNVVPLMPE